MTDVIFILSAGFFIGCVTNLYIKSEDFAWTTVTLGMGSLGAIAFVLLAKFAKFHPNDLSMLVESLVGAITVSSFYYQVIGKHLE